jgi:hypothetical protein
MNTRATLLGLGLAVAALVVSEASAQDSPRPPSGSMAPARDGDVAIRQELAAARRAGTGRAYERFIARHGDHPLARIARKERARLATRPGDAR